MSNKEQREAISPPFESVAVIGTGQVGTMFCELHAEPVIRAAVHARDEPLDDQPGSQLEPADRREDLRIQVLSVVGHRA